MDPEEIKAKLAQLKSLLGIDGAAEEDDLHFAIMDAVNALMDAERVADMLTGGGGGEASEEMQPAAARKHIAETLGLSADKAKAAKDLLGQVRCMVDLDAIKAALDQFEGEPTPEQVKQLVEGALLMEQAKQSGKKKDKPKASEDTTDATAATADAAEDKREAVDPAPDPAEREAQPPEAMEEGDEAQALEGQIVGWFSGWAEALGMEQSELLAVAEEKADELAAVIQGAPASGTEADGASAMSKEAEAEAKLSAAEVRSLNAKLKQRDDDVAKLTTRVSELDKQLGDYEIDKLIDSGQVLEDEREELIELRSEAPKAFAKRVARAKENPAVPKGGKYATKPAATDTDPADDDGADIDGDLMRESLSAVRAMSGRKYRQGSDEERAAAISLARKTLERRAEQDTSAPS